MSSVEIMYQPSEQFDLLQGFGVIPKVAEAIDKLHQSGMLAGEELSDQVIDAFREMPEQQALQVLNTFKSSNLNTINNRSAFLLGLIKQSYKGSLKTEGSVVVPEDPTLAQIGSAGGASQQEQQQFSAPETEMVGYDGTGAATEEYGMMDYDGVSGAADLGTTGAGGMYGMGGGMGMHQQGGMGMYGGGYPAHDMAARQRSLKCGPNAELMSQILARTGYPHEVTPSLRRYGGPPPDWTGPKPTQGVEVFLGKLPEDLYEDELIPLMEKCGKIYELRVIVDKEGYNRGFGFVTFCDKESAKKAVNIYSGYRIHGRRIVCNLNVQFTKLYVGGIPKDKTREQIFAAFSQEVDKLTDVVIQDPDDVSTSSQNRGFCFLEFDCYFDAAAARRKLMNQRSSISAWDNYRKFKVDWAIPLDNPDEAVASRSTVILVQRLNDSVTQGDLHEKFGKYGLIKSCNKTGSHAFITYQERSSAESAVEAENHQFVKDCQMEVTIHVPLTPIAKRMVEAIKGPRGGGNAYGGMATAAGGRGGGMMMGGGAGGFGSCRPRGGRGGGMDHYGMGGGMGQRRGGMHMGGGGFRGGRGGAGGRGMPFNPLERAGSFTRARLMNRGGTIFGDRGGVAGAMGGGGGMQGGYNPYGIQRGSGVFKNKQRGASGVSNNAGLTGGNSFAMQNTYSQLGSSFTQF